LGGGAFSASNLRQGRIAPVRNTPAVAYRVGNTRALDTEQEV
jgi:hypothetical protein